MYSFLVDLVAILIILGLFTMLALTLNAKAYKLSNGQDIESFKAELLEGDLERNQEFYVNVQSFVITFFLGGLLTLILTFLIFSYSRSVLWNYLTKNKFNFKIRWRWNLLNLLLLLIFVGYLIIHLLIILLTSLITLMIHPVVYTLLLGIINFVLFTFWILIIFLIYHSFAKKEKVGQAIMEGFHLLKEQWKPLRKVYLFALLTVFILNLLLYLLTITILPYSILTTLLNLLIFIIFVSWMRVYTLNTIKK